MKITFTHVILCLLMLATLLSVINILLMVKYNNDQSKSRIDFKADQTLQIHQLPTDKTGTYHIHRNFIRSKNGIKPSNDLVLASHCTSNHLHHVITLCESWSGPISIAIFEPIEGLQLTFIKIHILYQCFPKIHHQVSVHMVYPASELPHNDRIVFYTKKAEELSTQISCANAYSFIEKDMFVTQNYGAKVAYPNNLLRNVAKSSVNSQFSMVIDIDMVPNGNLYQDFLMFSRTNNLADGGNGIYDDKSVFVLPAFEVDSDSTKHLPKNKRQLITLLKMNKVRPFYYGICWKCQKPIEYDKWASLQSGLNEMNVGYEVVWRDPWEPFFIASRSSVDYDERFKQYGFNRISQACELHVAGYRFFVLDKAFLLHKGYKTTTSFHETKQKENEQNKILFRKFKTELKTKYPDSNNRCY